MERVHHLVGTDVRVEEDVAAMVDPSSPVEFVGGHCDGEEV